MHDDIISLGLYLCSWLASKLQTNGLGLMWLLWFCTFACDHKEGDVNKFRRKGTIRDIRNCLFLVLSSFSNCFLARPLLPNHCRCRGFCSTCSNSMTDTQPGGNSVDEGSVCCRDLYLTTHNIYKGHNFMPPAGFEPTFPTSERPLGSAPFDNFTFTISAIALLSATWIRTVLYRKAQIKLYCLF